MKNRDNLLAKEKTTKENRIWVRIASACNNKCLFCLDSEAQDGTFPDEEKVYNDIRSWYKSGYYNRIIISWWEASINPKFPLYIQFAKNLWYDRIQTVTNGNMFYHESFCKKVFDAWLQEVTFSFHGHNPALHDYLVAVPWAFKKSLKWLIYVKKYYPNIIVNIDIVVNKVNIKYLPDIVKFFMKLGVLEFDILQIIPFWRWFSEYKNTLFYNVQEYKKQLNETWELSKLPWVYMWTNRFYPEAFEGYEDLIQDPRKIKSEIMWEWYHMFDKFIKSSWKIKPDCYWSACDVCFQNQFCHDYLNEHKLQKQDFSWKHIIEWEEFPSSVYEKYGDTKEDFILHLKSISKPLINIPKCLWWTWVYQKYSDIKQENTLEDYTYKYIKNLYRKKSLRCDSCKYNSECKGLHLNFIRAYWFEILNPIK